MDKFYALQDERGMYVHAAQKMGGRNRSVRYTLDIYEAKTTTQLRRATRWLSRINTFAARSLAEIQAGKNLSDLTYYACIANSWRADSGVFPVKLVHLTLTKTGEEPQNAV